MKHKNSVAESSEISKTFKLFVLLTYKNFHYSLHKNRGVYTVGVNSAKFI